MMSRALLIVGFLATLGFAATGVLGYRLSGDGETFQLHLLLGLVSCLLLLFSHCWIMFFLIGTGKAIKEHPEKLRAIQAARRDGTKFIYEHTDEAIKILSKTYEPMPAKDVALMVKEIADAKFWTEGRIEMPLLENTVRAMKGVGLLQKDVDLAKMVDSSLLPADLQK